MISLKWLIFIYHSSILLSVSSGSLDFVGDPDFSNYQLVYPKIYHGREKREISSSKETKEGKNHIGHLSIMIYFKENEYILDLQLNKGLLPKNYFEKHQKDGKYVVNKPKAEDTELCHYNGHIRGIQTSWVALSTCNGIRGVMYDGKEIHYIENAARSNFSNSLTDTHVVYSHSDLKSNFSCGFTNSFNHIPNRITTDVRSHRFKRNAEMVQGPYNANRFSRFIELVLVVDNKEYKSLNKDTARVNQHCKDIVNIINSLYIPLNIFVALVGVVIWTERDECELERNGDSTLTHFLKYRRENLVKEHPNDNAQLLTKLQFESGVVGKALKGPICTYEFSGGVNVDHSNVVGLVAATVAHEMGHNLGMEHDTENNCACPSERCIMAPSSSSTSPTEWSSCSKEYLALAFEHGMDYCLRNKPQSLFEGPVCGNGFVEPGEQCDCGLKNNCNNPCCNASICMLHTNASCGTGECCDLQTCKPQTAGTMCRSAEHECDLPEYCTGQSEYCPDDVFKIDGEICSNGTSFCYQGNCRSHTGQCRILWGPSGVSSDLKCYQMNTKGNQHGNCGYHRLNQTYIKCDASDVECGMLQCVHYNERLEFGLESAAILSHSFINNGEQIIPCRTALVDFGLNEIDPGLAPNGAKCGKNHMCVNQKCTNVDSFRANTLPNACPDNCNGNGICNSKGRCHCNKGFAPPSCEYSGPGGSEDSGPAENPANYNKLRTLFWYMMLALVPLFLVLTTYSYYVRKSPSYFWKRNQRRTVHCEKSVQIHINLDNDRGGGVNSTVQSLLSNDNKTSKINEEIINSSFKDNLIGNFKGFSITPLSNGTLPNTPTKSVPMRPAPIPVHNVPVAAVKPMRIVPSVQPSAVDADLPKQPPLLPPPNITSNRPLISSPTLDNTTSSTVIKLINKELPVRPAPAPPVSPTKNLRPNSTPCILDTVDHSAIEKTNPKPQSHTLNRIASLISKSQPTKSQPTKSQPSKSEEKKEVVSLKAAKIDRDTLKRLKISDPIPLNEPSIPVEPLPSLKDQEKSKVIRAQSMRLTANKQRPGVPSFGSMRMSSSRRPTSIPACSRPTSPPPCPPAASNIGVPGYQLPASAKNTKQSDAESEDNIYAVIEENPEEEVKCVEGSPVRCPILDNEDCLLKEIVSEIQARNLDSIYTPSNKSKSTKQGTSSSGTNVSNTLSNDNNQLYENTSLYYDRNASPKSNSSSSSSGGYLRPIKSDASSKVAVGTNSNKLKVPEKSAPGYKPFSTPKKPITPITTLSAKNMFLAERKINQNNTKSSQANVDSSSEDAKSSVSSVVSKFNTANVLRKTSQPISRLNLNTASPSEKSTSNSEGAKIPKTASVASIQKRFEQTSSASNKSGKPNFKR